jgi:transposase-like protein
MAEGHCKKCGSVEYVKSGFVRGLQRYKCKGCGCNFTATPLRGKPAAMKALAVLLYAMGNATQGMIARLFNVSHVAVYNWIREEGEKTPEPSIKATAGIVPIDEMWHFVNGKKTRFGSGKPLTLWHGEPWPGRWVGVMTQPVKNFSIKSGSKDTPSSLTTGKAFTALSPKTSSLPAKT